MSKTLDRRTFLRGTGAAVALPFLDCMRPLHAQAAPAKPRRTVFVYIPNGVNVLTWQITKAGADYAFPEPMKPLEKHRAVITPISGLLLLLLVFFGPVLPLVNTSSNRISRFTNVTLAVGLFLTFWLGHPLVPLGSLAFSFLAVYVGRRLGIGRAWFNDMRFKDKPEHDEFFRRYCEAFRKVFDARARERSGGG